MRSQIIGHLQPPRIPDIAPPNPNPVYENVPVPQRPLATSSPPRSRPQQRIAPALPYRQHHSAPPPLGMYRGGHQQQQGYQVPRQTYFAQRPPSRTTELDVFESSAEATQESSSGFGSRNTTSQNTQSSSSRSGLMTSNLDSSLSPSNSANATQIAGQMTNFGLNHPPHVPSPRPLPQPLDLSADDHYEFDSINVDVVVDGGGGMSDSEVFVARRTRVSPSTEGIGSGLYVNGKHHAPITTSLSLSATPPSEDIEARLRAMREEFHLYRQRQLEQSPALGQPARRRGPVLESAC